MLKDNIILNLGHEYKKFENNFTFYYSLNPEFDDQIISLKIYDDIFNLCYYHQKKTLTLKHRILWVACRIPFSKRVRIEFFNELDEKVYVERIELEKEIDFSVLKDIPFLLNYRDYDVTFGVFHEIYVNKEYDHDVVSLESGDIVVDIGSNIGLYAHYAIIGGAAKVYCCEPDPVCYSILEKEFSDINNIYLSNYAISNKDGEDILNIYDDHCDGKNDIASNSWDPKYVTADLIPEKQRLVKTIKFKNFIKENNIEKIDLLKVDCEGGEHDIFIEENLEYFRDKVSKIIIEYHGKNENIIEFLTKANFDSEVKEKFEGLGNIFSMNKNI